MAENKELEVTESDVDSAVLEALSNAKNGLSKDAVAAVLALQNEIEINQTLIDLLNNRKIKAKYTGDKSAGGEPLKSEDFIFSTNSEAGQQSIKEESQEQ